MLQFALSTSPDAGGQHEGDTKLFTRLHLWSFVGHKCLTPV